MTFRTTDAELLWDGFCHGVMVEVVIGAEVEFVRSSVIACTSNAGTELVINRVLMEDEVRSYRGLVTNDLGISHQHARMIAVDIIENDKPCGRASLNCSRVWRPGDENSRHHILMKRILR